MQGFSEKYNLSLLILESFNLFAGVFSQKFLLPHYNWKVTSRLSGYFTKNLIFFFISTENPILLKKTQKTGDNNITDYLTLLNTRISIEELRNKQIFPYFQDKTQKRVEQFCKQNNLPVSKNNLISRKNN